MKALGFTLNLRASLADALYNSGIERGAIEVRHFPDGETYVRLDTPVADRDVLLFCSLNGPDALILPLLFAAHAAREQGARRVGLVAPYLAYMRQDMAFQDGEAITSRTFAGLVSEAFDWLVTVDPHLHRFASLDELYSIETTTITSAGPIAEWIGANVARPFLLGPDVESQQWVGRIAAQIAAPFTVFSKERRGDLAVQISAGEFDLADHTPVIVDDIISSAHTMAEAVTLLRHRGHAAPVCIGVHGLFSSGGLAVLRSSEPQDILVSDTVDHAMTRFSVSQPLIEAVSAWVASQ